MKKKWPYFLVLALLVCGLAIYAQKPEQQPRNPQEGTLDTASGITGEKAPEPAEESWDMHSNLVNSVAAACKLHEANWILCAILQQQAEEEADQELISQANDIMESIAELYNSERFRKNFKTAATEDGETGDGLVEGKVSRGDTISTLLESAGKGNVDHYIRAAKKVFSLKSFRDGQPYRIYIEPESGLVRRFEYEINSKNLLVVEGQESPQARLEDIEYDYMLDTCESVIEDNLFKAVADRGEKPELALRLVKLFGSEINFTRNIEEGDSFSVLVEKRYRNGEYKGYGRILAAKFINKGKLYEAFLFRDENGNEAYFNAQGENLHKALLQSPLAVTRVTSRYSHKRFHPVLGHARPHLGVDYGAPTGTPVKAVGDGTVTGKGWAGGYGNQIVIRHNASLESLYSHLSGFARGLREGQKVSQGQVIGYVGSTGLSTGPHLDFRLRQKGEFINPVKAINPRGAPVPKELMPEFIRVRDEEKANLAGKMSFNRYTPTSILPASFQLPKSKGVAADSGKGKKRSANARVQRDRKSRQLSGRFEANKRVALKKTAHHSATSRKAKTSKKRRGR